LDIISGTGCALGLVVVIVVLLVAWSFDETYKKG
jgi:hypothetical protein